MKKLEDVLAILKLQSEEDGITKMMFQQSCATCQRVSNSLKIFRPEIYLQNHPQKKKKKKFIKI